MEDKNGMTANNVAVMSDKKVWFKCSKCGHEWRSKISNRISSNNQGCPSCGREKARRSLSRSVICIETNVEYESISDATKKTGINNISVCCRGRLGTSGGYH